MSIVMVTVSAGRLRKNNCLLISMIS